MQLKSTLTIAIKNMENNNKKEEKETLKALWLKFMLDCARLLIKIGNSIVEKMGDDGTKGDTPNVSSSPEYNATDIESQPKLKAVGEDVKIELEGTSLSSKKLVRNVANLINEYDRLASEAEDKNFRTFYNDTAIKLIENLILAGCISVNPQEDELFDFNRHATRPFSLPTNQYIKRTTRLGVALDVEVLIKAIVELK